MIRTIVKYGHPVLRQKGREVSEITPEVRKLAEDMLETMVAAEGVGLAAQQVGVALQMAVVDVAGVDDRPSTMQVDGREVSVAENMPLVLINPVLELSQDRVVGVEGCLSFPRLTADIVRSAKVRCQATGLDGQRLDFTSTGLLARALQHEVDHLNGVLFIDRCSAATKAAMSGKLKRLKREVR
jgi:peptide deformylase